MALLEQEEIRLQAAVDAAVGQASAQQQALSAAQARVSVAQSHVADAQSQLPALQATVAAAESRAADLDAQVEAHLANEPEPTIEVDDGKPPRPNPAWRTWKRRLDQLVAQRDQARADIAAAQGALGNGQRTVTQAQIDVQLAERQVGEATTALQLAQAALATAQQRVVDLARWRTEIARDPLDRVALEQSAAELSTHAMAIEESLTMARFRHEDARDHLASLIDRNARLSAAVSDINSRIPAAQSELQAAQAAADAASAALFDFIATGP